MLRILATLIGEGSLAKEEMLSPGVGAKGINARWIVV